MSPRFQRKSQESTPDDELGEEELLLHTGQALPDRAAMSTIDADIAIPVNPELAADVLSGMDEDDGDVAHGHEADEHETPD